MTTSVRSAALDVLFSPGIYTTTTLHLCHPQRHLRGLQQGILFLCWFQGQTPSPPGQKLPQNQRVFSVAAGRTFRKGHGHASMHLNLAWFRDTVGEASPTAGRGKALHRGLGIGY